MNSHNKPSFASRFSILGIVRPALIAFTVSLAGATVSLADIQVKAYHGPDGPLQGESSTRSLGVGRVSIDLPPGASDAPLGDDRFAISDAAGRVLYPAAERERVRRILRNLLGIERPRKVTFYFLFTGDGPLELDVFAPDRVPITVVPRDDREDAEELLDEWWDQYVKLYERVHDDAEYPVGVQTYLTAMWAERLGREMPQLEGSLLREQDQGGAVVGKLTADEAYRASVLRDLMAGKLDDRGPVAPLPPHGVNVAGAATPTAEVAVESIATHVPDECFYVRFGTFTNYLWFRDFMKRWQGDLGNMLVLRSIRRELTPRITGQLALPESKLADMLGPQVIRDVAIIGMDPYFRDGAAVGVVFQAANNFLLGTNFNQNRTAVAKKDPDATLEQVEIAGQQVSYLSTPDGSLRSYYVTHGEFHLVTNSQAMVERFLAASEGERPLAAAPDFLTARQRAPVGDDDTVFVYLSQAFLTQVTSPEYRIELDRRIRSIESARALQLARLAAQQEGAPNGTVDELIRGGFLPVSFANRCDGAECVLDDYGRMYETTRGYFGQMIPIVDNLPKECSVAELRRYEDFSRAVRTEAGGLVPLTICIHHEPLGGEAGEQIGIDLHLQRYSTTNLAPWAKKLGPAAPLRVAPIAGDVASVEVVLDGMLGGGEPFHAFAGLRDGRLPLGIQGGMLTLAQSLPQSVEGYLGAWPKPQMLERWLGRPRGPYDADGFVRTGGLFDLWIHRVDDFLLFSFKRHVLAEVGRQLAMIEAQPAQARLWIDDLVGTQYEEAACAWGYARTRQTSASGSRFRNSLVQQLHVDKHHAAELANELVDGEFVCPLGGEYRLVEVPGGVEAWASTAAAPNNQFLLAEIPPDYHFPLVTWFRGMTAELTRGEDSLTLSAIIDTGPVGEDNGTPPNSPPSAKPPATRDPRQPTTNPAEKSVLKREGEAEELPAPDAADER